MDNRKKQKTYRFKLFNCLDVNAVREYLESMSAKGWIFTGYKGFFMAFEKSEPQKIRYHVEMFHNGSVFESVDTEESWSYIGQREAEGWEFIDSHGRLYIFASDYEDVEIMQRAPEEELRIAGKCIRSELIFLPIIALLCGWNYYSSFDVSWPTEFIEYGNFHLIWLLLMVFCLFWFLRSAMFYMKNKWSVSKGKNVQYPKGRIAKCFNWCISFLLIFAAAALAINMFTGGVSKLTVLSAGVLVIVLVGILGVRFLWSGSGKARQIMTVAVFSFAAVAVILSMAVIMPHVGSSTRSIEYYDEDGDFVIETVSDDVIPLTAEDIGMDTSDLIAADSSYDRYSSIFGTVTDYWQNYYREYEGLAADISYNIATVRFAWVKERLVNEYLTDDYYDNYSEFENITEKEAALWGAESVFSSVPEYGGYARLVVYENAVLFITNSDVEYTEDVIEIVKMKLEDEL